MLGSRSSITESKADDMEIIQQNQQEIENMDESQKTLNEHELSSTKEQEAKMSAMMQTFKAESPEFQKQALLALLNCSSRQILIPVQDHLENILKFDIVGRLPSEIGCHILSFLDAMSICRASLVNKKWNCLSGQDLVWHRMCAQHIDKKCMKCGWELPLMMPKQASLRSPASFTQQQDTPGNLTSSGAIAVSKTSNGECSLPPPPTAIDCSLKPKRTWKQVYMKRYIIENNWRLGRYHESVIPIRMIVAFWTGDEGILFSKRDDVNFWFMNLKTLVPWRTNYERRLGGYSHASNASLLVVYPWRTNEPINLYTSDNGTLWKQFENRYPGRMKKLHLTEKYLVCCIDNSFLWIIDVYSGKETVTDSLWTPDDRLENVYSLSKSWSEDSIVIVSNHDRPMRAHVHGCLLFDLIEMRVKYRLQKIPWSTIVWRPDHVSAMDDGNDGFYRITKYNPETGEKIQSTTMLNYMEHLCSNSSRIVLTPSSGNSIYVWDTDSMTPDLKGAVVIPVHISEVSLAEGGDYVLDARMTEKCIYYIDGDYYLRVLDFTKR